MAVTFAYLAEGKLYLQQPRSKAHLVDSPFVQQMLERQERDRQRNGWKDQGMGWSFSRQRMNPFLADQINERVRQVQFTGVAGAGRELFYAISAANVGGLFCLDTAEQHERRLLHRAEFRVGDLARHPRDGTLAMSLRLPDGSANLATMSAEGRGVREITEGDSVDEAPRWVDVPGKVLVFQSAGVGRNAAGFPVALGPYAIQKLDLDSGKFTTLLEDEAFDLLCPSLGADGTLHFLRRPYQPHGPPVSGWKVALDILLFPIRVAVAIVHFLNVFSMIFSRKPLMTAGGPPKEGPDTRVLMMWGRYVDATRAAQEPTHNGAGGLVPRDWELVHRTSDGQEQVLAQGVLCYDLSADGSIIYTDGTALFHRTASGEIREVGRGRFIERVCVV